MATEKKIVYDPTKKTHLVEASPVKDEKFEATVPEEQPKKRQKKTKEAKTVEPKTQTFPVKGTVNAYGFIHLSNGIASAFGAPKGTKTPIIIDLQEGALIIRKA